MVTFFKVIKKVLDVAYEELEEKDEKSKDKRISATLDTLSQIYNNIYENGGPDYGDPFVRFAYIFRYTTAHAEMIAQRIRHSSEIKKILGRKKVAITCIGGGPGSDILGFFKYLLENKTKKPAVKFFLIDGESGWSDSWADIDTLVSEEIPTSKTFVTVDVTNPKEWQKHKKPLQSDIFTLSFFLSELHKHKKEANKYFKHVITSAESGSIFLIIDFNHGKNKKWADELIEGCGLKILEQKEEPDFRLPSQEQRTDLGRYVKFGNPRLTGNIFHRICVVP